MEHENKGPTGAVWAWTWASVGVDSHGADLDVAWMLDVGKGLALDWEQLASLYRPSR